MLGLAGCGMRDGRCTGGILDKSTLNSECGICSFLQSGCGIVLKLTVGCGIIKTENHTLQRLTLRGELHFKPDGTEINLLSGAGW